MMNGDNPTKDLTSSEKLDRILTRLDKIEDRLGKLEEDRARETRKLGTMLAAIQEVQEGLKGVRFELRRLNAVFEKVAGEQYHQSARISELESRVFHARTQTILISENSWQLAVGSWFQLMPQ
jgi:predicted nuclease with TOPRIM domain